jgi:hypothetical protein
MRSAKRTLLGLCLTVALLGFLVEQANATPQLQFEVNETSATYQTITTGKYVGDYAIYLSGINTGWIVSPTFSTDPPIGDANYLTNMTVAINSGPSSSSYSQLEVQLSDTGYTYNGASDFGVSGSTLANVTVNSMNVFSDSNLLTPSWTVGTDGVSFPVTGAKGFNGDYAVNLPGGSYPPGTTYSLTEEISLTATSTWTGVKGDINGGFSADPAPEPSSLLLFGAGLLGVGLLRRKKHDS